MEDFYAAPPEGRAKTAIRNFLEQGRSVTWALEHLKNSFSSKEEWQSWWDTASSELRDNPVAKWFYRLRNPVVKGGRPVDILRAAQLAGSYTFPPPDEMRPPGATGWTLDSDLVPWWTCLMEAPSRRAQFPGYGGGIRLRMSRKLPAVDL
jgi:hypothetical protein